MKTIEQLLSEFLQAIINVVFPNINDVVVEVISTNNPVFGDYQTNIAMKLKGQLDIKNPREIAQKILNEIEKTGLHEAIKKIEIAGAGFINIFLKSEWIAKRTKEVLNDNRLGVSLTGDNKTIIIDYSSPNIAKSMHIGHLRSTIIGASLYSLLKFAGYNVIGDNHIGDWGTQFGKLIVGYNKWLDEEAFENDPISELERLYVEFSNQSEKDPSLEDEARAELLKLQQGYKTNLELWEKFIELSLKRFNEVYDRLGVKFDVVYGESHYNFMLKDIVEQLKKDGIAEKSEGAYVIFLDDSGLHPYLIQKSDGAFLYATTEIACLKYRLDKWKPYKIITVTDNRQEAHFKQLLAVSKRLRWCEDTELVHIVFGRLTFGGEIMATRSGNVIRLKELLDEAKRRAKAVVDSASPHLSEEERDNIAETVGIATIKYFDLSQNRASDITFTWESALALQGNTAAYLLYSYARIQSIFRKYEDTTGKKIGDIYKSDVSIVNEDEEKVLKLALKFPSILEIAINSYKPNIICEFIYNLSQEFNSFYNKHRVINAEDTSPESRLLICDIVAKTIKKSLEILTIKTVNRM